MTQQSTTFFLSWLAPGLGYFHKGDNPSFYKTILVFFSILAAGAALRLFTTFWGLIGIVLSIIAIYTFAAIHASMKVKYSIRSRKSNGFLKFSFTILFLLVTGLSFANRRVFMGFDIMSMNVAVMQPTLLEGDQFLVDTWVNKGELERGTIVVHSFNGQEGLYLNRIIAKEGDLIEIKDGHVMINGKVQAESYVLASNATKPESINWKRMLVPKGHFFVMGDNRDASFGDSRFSGTITLENIVARPTDILNSPDKLRAGRSIQ